MELLVRIEKTLRRRRRERAYAGPCRADDVAEHRMLALELGVLDVLAPADEIGEALDDQRLRCYRVGADSAHAGKHGCIGGRLVRRHHALPDGDRAHAASIAIASLTGHTSTQMPQPLQWR